MDHAIANSDNVCFFDAHPAVGNYRSEILAGLSGTPKSVDPKWFYDSVGSELFAEITRVPEYYPTRTEVGLLTKYREQISQRCGRGCVFIEPGSGNSEKVRLLLDDLVPAAYVPLDISAEFLRNAAIDLGDEYPWLPIQAICADFGAIESFQEHLPTGKRVIFYPGSTIGNMEPQTARSFLRGLRDLVGDNGGVLVGVDLHKDTARLEAAYNDSAGITARFNLNMLTHINGLLDADFDTSAFSHRAFYNEALRRIEMHLVSEREQTVRCAGENIHFEKEETVHTESSYKYTVSGFTELVAAAGLSVQQTWVDEDELFSLHYLAREL